VAICRASGVEERSPATASTNEGATEVENCRRGRKRHRPVSSIHVRASSSVSAPCPFWRILSARDASNCSDVKEKPRFQAGDLHFRNSVLAMHFPEPALGNKRQPSTVIVRPRTPKELLSCRATFTPEGEDYRLPNVLNPVEGPLDLSPRIQQSDWTSMRATGRVVRFRKFQQ
jgi:hypothetical protein